ncbi:MAG TPA: triose-phosphate isomerase [Candidatus Woesebacteria bacterium]|nr:triose-phosphate isomerase [Candidatus Woesebacteria bacterium]HPJ16623.1 triose-phosphate isomerase [Candidatus Woesebacteria bacterium]
MILVNFKKYPETEGEKGEKLARICKEVMEETGIKVIPVVTELAAEKLNQITEVWLQKPEMMEQANKMGIKGSLINHSDYRLTPNQIREIVKKKPEGFELMVCLSTLGQAEKWGKKLSNQWIAFEPKEYIGSSEKSVSSEKATTIEKMVKFLDDKKVLVGAGIKSMIDVDIACQLGAKGVLVATSVVKSEDPKAKLLELAKGFRV